MTDVYITSAGAYLPGDAVANDEMAARIGVIDDQSERIGRLVLRQNKIATRYYALDETGLPQISNAAMAALAGAAALDSAGLNGHDIDFLGAATTQGDLIVPGHASAVHGELAQLNPEVGSLALANFQSVCASASMALRAGYLEVMSGEVKTALITGSEFSSRWFRPGFYGGAREALTDKDQRMAAEFLRWTLSDGAGAVTLASKPRASGPAFKIDWTKVISLAHAFDVCMFAGANEMKRYDLTHSWSHYDDGPRGAAADGAIMLLQDMVLLKRIIRGWVGEYLKLVDDGLIVPAKIDWLLCHYSAHSLREELIALLKAAGAMIDEEKWFTNLPSKGNTGSASLFIMMEEFLARNIAKPGDKILCVNPESGRAIVSFTMMTAQ